MTRLHAAHFRALRALTAAVSHATDLSAAALLIEGRLAQLLDTPVHLRRQRPSRSVAAAPVPHPEAAEGPGPPSTAPVSATGPPPRPPDVAFPEVDAVLSLPLGRYEGELWSLELPGRWDAPRARAFLSETRETLAAALEAPALRGRVSHAEGVVASAFAFSRGLARVQGGPPLRQFVVDTIAEATHARLGSLALYEEAEGALHVAATRGYPSVFVEHVRVSPGTGVIGRVFESRRPMLVRDVRDVAGLQRRPRYRTASFLAVPLLAHPEVLGVATFADRHDGRPFDEGDLTAARALAAPAALALLNDRLADHGRELAHAATLDPLTGLFNRRHFHTRIEEEIERARRHGLELALLLIDIDDFKRINDSLGHLAGDYLLKQVAEVLKRSVRVFDVCTRYGGEEFAILMPGSSTANALVVAERIRSRVELASRDEGPIPPYLRITVSLGLAVLVGDSTSQELIARADRALYRAKAEGKNCVRVDLLSS